MAASRASSIRVLNRLAGSSTQARKLHMTGPTTFPSPLLTTERPAVNLPRDVAGLRDECQKRRLPTQGSKQDLIDRISADELMHTRAFSTAISRDQKRPAVSEADAYMALPPNGSQSVRHFNTSRSLKKVNDSSTIDFAYFPDFNPDMSAPSPTIQVPLVPQSVSGSARKMPAQASAEEVVLRPTIVTASADSTHISAPSALSDLHDNAAIDIGVMAEKVAHAAKRLGSGAGSSVEDSERMVKTVWNDLLDDVFGPKSAKA